MAHSYWSEFFNHAPFDPVRDIEYDEPESGSINHGRFHTMAGYWSANQMTPSDADLFATLTMLTERYNLNFGILHTCTLDSMGHRFKHDCEEMDGACCALDAQLTPYIRRWRDNGYEVIVAADHRQSLRGRHGGRGEDQQDVALYYFGGANGPDPETALKLTQLAPTVISRLGLPIPGPMSEDSFLN